MTEESNARKTKADNFLSHCHSDDRWTAWWRKNKSLQFVAFHLFCCSPIIHTAPITKKKMRSRKVRLIRCGIAGNIVAGVISPLDEEDPNTFFNKGTGWSCTLIVRRSRSHTRRSFNSFTSYTLVDGSGFEFKFVYSVVFYSVRRERRRNAKRDQNWINEFLFDRNFRKKCWNFSFTHNQWPFVLLIFLGRYNTNQAWISILPVWLLSFQWCTFPESRVRWNVEVELFWGNV